jgi:hypothetical protein
MECKILAKLAKIKNVNIEAAKYFAEIITSLEGV